VNSAEKYVVHKESNTIREKLRVNYRNTEKKKTITCLKIKKKFEKIFFSLEKDGDFSKFIHICTFMRTKYLDYSETIHVLRMKNQHTLVGCLLGCDRTVQLHSRCKNGTVGC
jgi:hypothetical protein